ncbi:MAG: PD-(D/E)XK nuclease family protein [Rhodocyclaceae bacterium]|nr:PD-(D/E)XK nuclease family protein [Rhodocyclaceae bacterium]MBK6552552.1 PD-(D/E)XK nuclease family protein [Rhodocyclaceae bacterium]MBK9312089.1 PD-(D/E)XK nuclease family protein [Rhodocyclaceae bacterium]MBK9953658.1 PD-(D/E)XK nuclease family protein [Rhodocyclaceae bacterium]
MSDSAAVVICATNRLARRLRERHNRAQQVQGLTYWAPLDALTLDAWLGRVTSEALLAGRIGARQAPRLPLSAMQERMLWERAIERDAEAAEDGEQSLFDREGLAAVAAEANDLAEVWSLPLPKDGEAANEELRRFLHWRRRFRADCEQNGWLEPARLRAWQLRAIEAGACRLPARMNFAGSDRYNPQERALMRTLAERGVEVGELSPGGEAAAAATVAEWPDRKAECRAVAAWAADRLARNPVARLGIVVPQLAMARAMLATALDDALHPEALAPHNAEMPRRYNFSLGTALAEQPIVAAGLRLLAIAAQPRRIAAADFGALLCGPYWSASASEADGRARLDVLLRERMPPELNLPGVLRMARRARDRGLRIGRCIGHLETLLEFGARHGSARRPSQWAMELLELLDAAGWPGERGLSSHEWQAKEAWLDTLTGLDALDVVTGKIGLAQAARLAMRQCRERVFQPETEGTPAIEVLGPLEAAGAEFDALWVLGINEEVWPPAPRPNPLLPADVQRHARSTHASAEVELEFALAVQRRLLRSAPEVVFSYARAEGDRPLRPSPLLAGLAKAAALPAPAATTVAARVDAARIESIDDHIAPPVPEGAAIAGGTGLLRAQALCPAWAFYRYRLGAQALAEPVAGLDAAERGTLLHRAMEHLWRGRDSRAMRDLGEAGRREAAQAAAAAAIEQFAERREAPLPPRYAALEREHLAGLLAEWLAVELRREAPFRVVGSEQRRRVEIEGLAIDVALDRLDELDDGGRLLIDYKTSRELKTTAWDGERIAEPQLPVYAAWALDEPPAAVAFARVRPGDCGFIGIGEAALVDGVKAVEDWPGVLGRWREAIAAVACEIRAGEAGVRVADESELRYCDVLPLLRLPEKEEQCR